MKENINEHDMTKKMMDVMRGGFKNILKENLQDKEDPDYTVDVTKGTNLYNQELKELQAINTNVTIEDFKIYPNGRNGRGDVKLSGVFLYNNDSTDSGVQFTFRLSSEAAKLSMQDVQLPEKFMDKLNGYFATWQDKWNVDIEKEDYTNPNGL